MFGGGLKNVIENLSNLLGRAFPSGQYFNTQASGTFRKQASWCFLCVVGPKPRCEVRGFVGGVWASPPEPIATAVSAQGAGGSILCPQSGRVSKTDLNRVRQGFVIQGLRRRWKRRCILHSRKGHFVERSIIA